MIFVSQNISISLYHKNLRYKSKDPETSSG